MNVAKIASALAVAGLLAGGGAAYLAKPASEAAASRAPTISPALAGQAAEAAWPFLARGGPPANAVQAANAAQAAKAAAKRAGLSGQGGAGLTSVSPVTARGGGAAGSNAARPAAARAAATQPAKFTAWANHAGRALLMNSLGILSKTKSDAAVQNIPALEADAGTLIADGNACLADPPPDYAASWNAAFAAMVQAGDDLAAGNLTGARAESHIVETEIYAFTAQAS